MGNEAFNIALAGTYVPRRCGIATFTHDLYQAVRGEMGNAGEVFVVAMDDRPEGYDYPPEVRVEIRDRILDDYDAAADFLGISSVDALLLQHEYGIYGGKDGNYVLRLVEDAPCPVISTLHTILEHPDSTQREIMETLLARCDKVVTMSSKGVELLSEVYGAPTEKVLMIPHGIPDVPFVDPEFYKDKFGVEGRKVLLTFGLLSPGKGIEYAIRALPEVVAKHPEVIYIVLGVTHPHIRAKEGEKYRTELLQMAQDLGVGEHVSFVNKFVELEELCQYIGAADIYITPYLKKEQITSGTLSYALGAGKAVVSTPYWHAEELLAEGRGVLVPFKSAEAIAEAIVRLLDNPSEFNAMRRKAYEYTRSMVWSKVGRAYIDACREAAHERTRRSGRSFIPTLKPDKDVLGQLPEVNPSHLIGMTDDTGMFQHASFSVPDKRFGYTTDDNARALMAATRVYALLQTREMEKMINTYLGFLLYAFDPATGRFRNFMDYTRHWMKETPSEDTHGRALWALGEVVSYKLDDGWFEIAAGLFSRAIDVTATFEKLRGISFVLVGLHEYLRAFGGDTRVRRTREILAEKLKKRFQSCSENDSWPWPESALTYANAVVPHAMLLCGQWIPDGYLFETGIKVLKWLSNLQTDEEGRFCPVGNRGWMKKGDEKPPLFDQQPIEAMVHLQASLEAYNATRDEVWLKEARRCLNWFLGANVLGAPLYDFKTGGCMDGLTPNGPNRNEGAESTLAWLLSLTALHRAKAEGILHEETRQE